MNEEEAFLQAMLQDPNDLVLRMVFADWLEERGAPRGELLRLTHTLTQSVDLPHRRQSETRLQELLAQGMQPIGPFCNNILQMRFAWIPAGTFLMGSPTSERDRFDNEVQHDVRLTKGFWLGVHPVTQAQYQALIGDNPSQHKGPQLPVDTVSWEDAIAFCNLLNVIDKKKYRLPTEAEWEYACRAGTTTPYHFGDSWGKLTKYAWYRDNSSKTTRSVGQLSPNAWGLYDMHGNIYEWCQDWFSWFGPSTAEPAVDPVGPGSGYYRVLRGGSFESNRCAVRSALRYRYAPSCRFPDTGFRVCSDAD